MSDPTIEPAAYWENRYREKGGWWSGNVNAALEREIGGIAPGTALDLGSGEGGDALWLARQGWSVTAVDISPTALAIGAAAQRPGDDITWVAADLAEWQPDRAYNLVTACFLHSEVELPRERILRRAAAAVAPGGMLLVVGHYGRHGHIDLQLPTPDEVLADLFAGDSGLDRGKWAVITSALVDRTVTGHDGVEVPLTDSVLRLRREPPTPTDERSAHA